MDALLGAGSDRWPQLILGVICMVMIANLKYGWASLISIQGNDNTD